MPKIKPNVIKPRCSACTSRFVFTSQSVYCPTCISSGAISIEAIKKAIEKYGSAILCNINGRCDSTFFSKATTSVVLCRSQENKITRTYLPVEKALSLIRKGLI